MLDGVLHIDYETRSEIDLGEVGTYVYACHPTTKILCMAVKYEDQYHLVHPNCRDEYLYDEPQPLRETLIKEDFSEEVLHLIEKSRSYCAHNFFFEYMITNFVLRKLIGPEVGLFRPLRREVWSCTMAKACYNGLPAKLENAAKVADLSELKDEEGNRIMKELSKPRKPTKKNPSKWHTREDYPDKFNKLYDYCLQDVRVESLLDDSLRPMPQSEQDIWAMTQRMNLKGVGVDREALIAINRDLEIITANNEKHFIDLTGGQVQNVRSPLQVKKYIKEEFGLTFKSLDKNHINQCLENADRYPDKLIDLLKVKKEISRSAKTKFAKMIGSSAINDKVYDCFKYHGAITGRWSSYNVQFQNMVKPRKEVSPEDLFNLIDKSMSKQSDLEDANALQDLSSCIRAMIVPAKGNEFYIVDYSSIEARITMWLSNCDRGLQAYANNEDLYETMAAQIYKTHNITKAQRDLGKQAVLGCGYGMGHKLFRAVCAQANVIIDEKQSKHAVDTYRSFFREVKASWYELEQAARNAMHTKKAVPCMDGRIHYKYKNGNMYCRLPNGRIITYRKFHTYVDVEKQQKGFLPTLAYTTVKEGKLCVVDTYGGKLLENIIQAIARDVFADRCLDVENKLNLLPVLLLHDELVLEIIKGFDCSKIDMLLCKVPTWLRGCPLDVGGEVKDRYCKI